MSFELPLRRTETEAIRALREALTTQTVERVAYYALDEDWPVEHRHDFVHEADTGVQLTLSSGILLDIVWMQRGNYEGLSAELREPTDPSPSLVTATDVSRTREWSPFVRRTFEKASFLWTEALLHAPEVLLALKLATGNNSVLLTLGEDQDGSLNYAFDAVVALFDERAAMTYVTALENSGWD
jgi:hypothetical protein